ncbi:MAG: tRNA 2-thiocytidine biosynthesis protein TtcA [Oscillospiraceae bacterium]|nr:tRNA 2-thiocytidine biosynthesis protein TtcA [Oscillospiraceae bacterium]
MEQLAGLIRRCVEDYDMISEGDRIAVGLSGGKDSAALLCAMSSLRRYYPKHFELVGVTVGLGFEGMDFTPVKELCDRLDVPYYYLDTDIRSVVFDMRREKNPCALCVKMRKGAFNDKLRELGVNKAALGHHMDDAVETFLMSLIYEGRISCFEPVTLMDRSGITQIRPMLYAEEKRITSLVSRYSLPVVKSTCPMDKNSKREAAREIMFTLSRERRDFKIKTFRAMQRLPLRGWAPVKREGRTKTVEEE